MPDRIRAKKLAGENKVTSTGNEKNRHKMIVSMRTPRGKKCKKLSVSVRLSEK